MATPSKGLSAGELQVLAARLRVGVPARAFREHLAAGDLAGAWDGIDPELRLVWARAWTGTHRAHLRGGCPERLATALACLDAPSQALWRRFASDQVQALHEVGRSEQQNPSPNPPRLPADIAVLYADPSHPGAWASPGDPRAVPMLMRWNGTTWLVANYGSETLPPTG